MPKHAYQHAVGQLYGVLLEALLKMQYIDMIIPLIEMTAKFNLILKYHRNVSVMAEKKNLILLDTLEINSLLFYFHRKVFEVKFRFRLGIHSTLKSIYM